MKRLYAWLAGLAGGAAVYRAFRRRPPAAPVGAGPDPADELKAKLAEARAGDGGPGDGAPVDEVSGPDVDARRRSVHERARTAIDEMQGE
jgi:hypothetical protein